MEKPASVEKIQLVAVLRTLGLSQDETTGALSLAKSSVVAIERWLKEAPLGDLEAFFDDPALQRVIVRELPGHEEVEPKVLVRAALVTADDILRHYRDDYGRKHHASQRIHEAAQTGAADRELGPHGRELLSLALRLRGDIELLPPLNAAALDPSDSSLRLWTTESRAPYTSQGSPLGSYDIRHDSLFDDLKQHLDTSPCWRTLEEIRDSFLEYRSACSRCYKGVSDEVRGRLSKLSDADLERMSDSLFVNASYRVRGSPGIDVRYQRNTTVQDGKTFWSLQLGAGWSVGFEEDPLALEPLVAVHKELMAGLPSKECWSALAKADRQCSDLIQSFRESLSSDSLLRKMVVNGRCPRCPGQ